MPKKTQQWQSLEKVINNALRQHHNAFSTEMIHYIYHFQAAKANTNYKAVC